MMRKHAEIEFFLDSSSNSFNKEPEVLDQAGVNYYLNLAYENPYKINYSSRYSFSLKFLYRLLGFFKWNKLKYTLFGFINYRLVTKEFLKRNKYNLVISGEDNTAVKSIFNDLRKEAGFKTIVIPFTVANHEEQGAAFFKLDEYHINTFKRKILFLILKKWKLKYHGKWLTREYLPNILSFEWMNIAPPQPFLPIGGKSDVIFFESEFIRDYYLRSGLKKRKFEIVPSPVFIDFTKQNSAPELKKLHPGKKIVLCSLPPDFLPGSSFKDYTEMVRFWCRVLSSDPNVKVFISLHPRTKIEDVEVVKEYDVGILDVPLASVMPEADIFVACISATIRYALTCKKPVLNFDMFHYNYTEYDSVLSVINVSTPAEFEKEYKNICTGKYDRSVAGYYEANKNYFGDLTVNHEQQITEAFLKAC